MEEIEVKFVNIDVPEVEKNILSLGAKKVGEFLYKRKTFDFPDKRLAEKFAWVRLRDEGDKVTLTYKERLGVGSNVLKDQGMKEIEIMVSSFEQTDTLLREIGLTEKFYEENKRVRYALGDLEFDIDTWPLLPPYLEIEGKSWERVEAVSRELGFDWDKHLRCSTMQIYADNGIDENAYAILTFDTQVKKEL